MKTKVKVIFPATKLDRPSWPYIGYDVRKRSKEVLSVLIEQLPGFEFSPGVYYSPEEAERAFESERGQFDGYLVYMTAMWSGVAEFYVRNAGPPSLSANRRAGTWPSNRRWRTHRRTR